MKVTIVAVIVCCVAGLAVSLIKSKGYQYAGTVHVEDGDEYEGRRYKNVVHCGQKCLTEDCQHYAVSEVDEHGVHCMFDVRESHLPQGFWTFYGDRPGNYFLYFIVNRF